jgi:TM2 domain-containing membrane protein YozV
MCIAFGKAATMHCKLGGTVRITLAKKLTPLSTTRFSRELHHIARVPFMTPSSLQVATVRSRSPLLAALLSALLCGLGQIYDGRPVKGVILIALMLILWAVGGLLGALTFGLGMLPFAIVAGALWVFGVVDAYAGGRRIHRAGFRA